jgi:hypothetical protein
MSGKVQKLIGLRLQTKRPQVFKDRKKEETSKRACRGKAKNVKIPSRASHRDFSEHY